MAPTDLPERQTAGYATTTSSPVTEWGMAIRRESADYAAEINTNYVAFAGPGKQTLYITAREGLYRIKTLAKGPERLGK